GQSARLDAAPASDGAGVVKGNEAMDLLQVEICEVGPRDGLQNHARQFSVAERIELINRLIAAGMKRIEAVSFVNDARVPRMAGAEQVVAGIDRPRDITLSGLVLNGRG